MAVQGQSDIPKAYDSRQVEGKWYQFWLEQGYFSPVIDWQQQPFVIIMPPPNVTGELHLGTAFTAVIEDTLVRWHRMKGIPTLWLPGTDHAGIAGQNVVEQLLAQEGLTRHDVGREKFIERMWEWVKSCRSIITEQHKRLGASCDWTRERFTMDSGPSRAVRTTFFRLYEKGLIYRGERIINWCPRCATALSDLEVDHQELSSYLYYIRYKLAGDREEYVTVATTRPETILGDTAVAVNPDDERYQHFLGREAILPALGRVIPIVADSAVDPSFGTGAVKMTPAHDPVDFDVARRQNLPLVNIMNLNATMNENAGPYAGLDRFVCRQALLADLEKEGLLLKTESYVHSVGHCQRCSTMVEPLVSKQWFVNIVPLAKPAINAVREGRIKIIPERLTKVYLNWMENIRDWCISRQLWWGHRIPVWYCDDCDKLTVAIDDPSACVSCGSVNIAQDSDVLDTWFSSALWPHSTLGWPEDTDDLKYFYPTSVIETGYDILFFWVARMIMMGLENTGNIPFSRVYLHGLIRDDKGEKMSKSRGNVVDPVQSIEKYSTDALRFALCTGSSPGNDMKLGTQKLEGSRNFANKLWNAARFVISNLNDDDTVISPDALLAEDRWILSRLNRVVADVNGFLGDYQLGEALRSIHDFFWSEFCDWYIEIAKVRLRSKHSSGGAENGGNAPSPLPVLALMLETVLRLLHPFMPFITEELWQKIRERVPLGKPASIMIASYPVADTSAFDIKAEQEMESVIDIVRSIRNARVESGVESARYIEAIIIAGQAKSALESHTQAITVLTRARPLTIIGGDELESKRKTLGKDEAKVLVLKEVEVILPLAGMIDISAESSRISREIDTNQAEICRLERLLEDDAFLARAPATIIEKQRQKLNEYSDKLVRLKERLINLA
ncbi:valine--tRNA ligase [Chloroflexota bacterium]